MKNIKITLIIMSFLFLACTNQKIKNENCVTYDSGFSICQDTIFVDIEGEITHALKYHDKFYVLSSKSNPPLISRYPYKRWLHIFSNGKIEKTIKFPDNLASFYLDFFVQNDSIILKPDMKDDDYYLTKKLKWKKIDKTYDFIFEDEKYYVHSLDLGEWGGKTWFEDKKTGIKCLIELTTPLINKIDTTYYLTRGCTILKIENPLKLNIFTYENIRWREKYGEPIGFDTVYYDSSYDWFECSFTEKNWPYFVTSFVYQNELFHIYDKNEEIFIVKIEDKNIKYIQKIGDNFNFYGSSHSYRCKNLNGNNELLKFYTDDEQLFGLMEVIDNKILIHYFKNKADLKSNE